MSKLRSSKVKRRQREASAPQNKTDIIRLGKEEYSPITRDALPSPVRVARQIFLNLIAREARHVLDALAGKPFEYYKAAGLAFDRTKCDRETDNLSSFDKIRVEARAEGLHRFNHPSWRNDIETADLAYDENLRRLKESIVAWSKTKHLDAVWCREVAYETLDRWHMHPTCYEARIWKQPLTMAEFVCYRGKPVFSFHKETTYPRFTFRAEERKRILEACAKELDAFLDECDRVAEKHGAKKIQTKRGYDHFRWFLYYQVELWDKEKCCKHFNQSFDAMQNAIKEIRVALTDPNNPQDKLLRPRTNAGRPKKNK
ncbi:MAG: hypothetical protein M3371_04730 [Acidobacteriota bacterium]|nr:hypothetical protein [Acidobacteriota bacterium]